MTGREALPGGHALGWGLRRSWHLIQAFRVEQPDPHRFYRLLAENLPDPQDRARFLREVGGA